MALYYAPRIFESMGAAKDTSMMQTIIMGFVNVVFTAVAIVTVDKWGRKPLLMTGSIGMAVGMFAISALAFNNIIGISTLVFIIIYTASFMMSWGPICWVLISEIFPNKIRESGSHCRRIPMVCQLPDIVHLSGHDGVQFGLYVCLLWRDVRFVGPVCMENGSGNKAKIAGRDGRIVEEGISFMNINNNYIIREITPLSDKDLL